MKVNGRSTRRANWRARLKTEAEGFKEGSIDDTRKGERVARSGDFSDG